jgi:hypothetical protein
MGVPFAMRWEVAGFPWAHGSFTEAVGVRALGRDEPGDFWVERLHPDLKPEHRARVLRRWWLGTQLTQPAWPRVVDAGDDGDMPWVVLEAPGRRVDGSFRYPDPRAGLTEVRGLAIAMAEAEALLLQHYTSPRLGVRPTVVARDSRGRLKLQLAALDATPDLGFPGLVETALFTPEELTGQPATARTNVFVLGWLAALSLTGEWPYAAKLKDAGGGEKAARELLAPLVLSGALQLSVPESVKAVEGVLRRALAPAPSQRFADSAAFAEALKPFTGALRPAREPAVARVSLAPPESEVEYEALPAKLEAKQLAHMDSAPTWAVLADQLAEVKSPRARLIRAQLLLADEQASAEVKAKAQEDAAAVQALPGVTPTSPTEALRCEWKWGYVRALEVTPMAAKDVTAGEQETVALAAATLLQHPSLRFVQEVRLSGKVGHAKAWVEALQRSAPPALKRVVVAGAGPRDPWAIETGFRFPKWTFRWTGADGEAGGGLGQKLKRLFGR